MKNASRIHTFHYVFQFIQKNKYDLNSESLIMWCCWRSFFQVYKLLADVLTVISTYTFCSFRSSFNKVWEHVDMAYYGLFSHSESHLRGLWLFCLSCVFLFAALFLQREDMQAGCVWHIVSGQRLLYWKDAMIKWEGWFTVIGLPYGRTLSLPW